MNDGEGIFNGEHHNQQNSSDEDVNNSITVSSCAESDGMGTFRNTYINEHAQMHAMDKCICKTNYIFMSLQLHVKCVESKAPLKPSSPGPSASVVCHAHVHTHPMQRNLQFLHGFRWECLAKYFLPTFIRTVIKFLCVFVLREGHPLGSHHTNCL